MALDNTLRGASKLERIGKTVLTTILAATTLNLASCSKNVVNVDDINIDTKHLGAIAGQVTKPVVDSDTLAWVGFSGANVKVAGTDKQTRSLVDGSYAIDSLPAGGYNIIANDPAYNYGPDTVSAIVVKQQTAYLQDHQLPITNRSSQGIIYGNVRWNTGEIFEGRLNINEAVNTQGNWRPGALVNSIQYTPDGKYASNIQANRYYISSPDGNVTLVGSPRNDGFFNSTAGNRLFSQNIIITPK